MHAQHAYRHSWTKLFEFAHDLQSASICERNVVGEIAEVLSLSDKTVSTYKARILEKLHLNTTAELIRYLVENKLVD